MPFWAIIQTLLQNHNSYKNLFLNIITNVFKITNGFDYINKEVNLDKKFSISHVGSLYPERNPKFLWDVLEELFDGSLFSDLQINFIGNTSEKIKKELSNRKFKKSTRILLFEIDFFECSSKKKH